MSHDPVPEPDAIPARRVLVGILGAAGGVAIAAGVVWVLFPTARQVQNRSPTPVAGVPLEIRPVEVYADWLERQRALLAGAEGRMPIEAAMAVVAAGGSLDAEGRR
ncbi:hypothetical protein GI374_05535 [Paracoccus sp. S-4012]|uniref:hypothetical protein n=1 Tax=Paracoccus sp. S-4012 TaxID=2665648 RepID=UPI0012B02F79|nr:hypothetical protein [Paracoccus sp. S-4012]MRX49919.1 hypothetical protein [Paracoccus sp. S-4012]